MAQTENQKKLLKILNEIFQLDQSDLDFGIYRIMNTKSKEIREFLENDLIQSVKNAFSSNDNNTIQKELDEALQQAQSLGADPKTLPKVIALREQLSSTLSSKTKENELFSHLANFFKRYYKDGDFVSLRRYKKDTYAIPYEGKEVKLHWANSDQYYIKNEILFLDDILLCPIKYDEVMGKIKIFKEVAQKIIAFLTQLEELQKRLWEKKKFIIETNYCYNGLNK